MKTKKVDKADFASTSLNEKEILLDMNSIVGIKTEKRVNRGMKKFMQNPDDDVSSDNGSNKDFGSFDFVSNMRADYGISFKEGKHIDNGPSYNQFLQDKGLDKVKITKNKYNDLHSTRSNATRLGQSFLTKM